MPASYATHCAIFQAAAICEQHVTLTVTNSCCTETKAYNQAHTKENITIYNYQFVNNMPLPGQLKSSPESCTKKQKRYRRLTDFFYKSMYYTLVSW